MRGRLWNLVSAAIGAAILVVLVVYGTQYGTWVDETGPLRSAPPSFLLPFVIAGLATVLVVGGVMASAGGPERSRLDEDPE